MYTKTRKRLFSIASLLGYEEEHVTRMIKRAGHTMYKQEDWEKYLALFPETRSICPVCNGVMVNSAKYLGSSLTCIEYPGHSSLLSVATLKTMVDEGTEYIKLDPEERRKKIFANLAIVSGGICPHDHDIFASDCDLCKKGLETVLQYRITNAK